MDLLGKKYIEKITSGIEVPAAVRDALSLWQIELKRINDTHKRHRPNEKVLHEQFFSDVFVKALGYEKREAGVDLWTIESEYKADVDKTRPDGVLGFFDPNQNEVDIQAVIELKGYGTNLDLLQNRKQDRRTPTDQAFSYAHKYDAVDWVIVSNYSEVRFYSGRSSKRSITFNLSCIMNDETQLRLFFLLLSRDNLLIPQSRTIESRTAHIIEQREVELAQITDNFYNEYKAARMATAKAILSERLDLTIDSAVGLAQILMDRIIFIAFLEDLDFIPHGTIAKACSAQNDFNPVPIWDNFKSLFAAIDSGNKRLVIPSYNGGLFRQNIDIDGLNLDDTLFERYKALADYDFESDLSVNVLGHVFEQSITDLDDLKAGLRDDDDIDTRRHDEGAFYTPDSITAYIVEQTIGTYLEGIRRDLGLDDLPELSDDLKGKKKKDAHKKHVEFWAAYAKRVRGLKIVDPSCGSGAFLVDAFDYLIVEGERINAEFIALDAPSLFYRFDLHLLQHSLYGVDLSQEAVNITRLSLWLKMANKQEKLISLDDNIKFGNAVAGFDWQAEFPDLMEAGGFDIVLGNPPYVRQELIKDIKPALKGYINYCGKADLYVYFYELGYNLLKDGGLLGYISSNKWMRAGYGEKLRQFLIERVTIHDLLDLGETDLFKGATTYTNIITFAKQPPPLKHELVIARKPFSDDIAVMPQERLNSNAYNLESSTLFWSIIDKMHLCGTALGDWDIDINYGVKTGLNEAFIIDSAIRDKLIAADANSAAIIKPLLRGRNIKRWHHDWQGIWLIFTRQGTNIDNYPAIEAHLERYRNQLEKRAGTQSWFVLQSNPSVDTAHAFEGAKIVYPVIRNKSDFFLDKEGYYQNDKGFHIISNDNEYLVAILNSDLAYWYLLNAGSVIRGGYLEFRENLLVMLPVPMLSKLEQKPFIDLSELLHRMAAERYDKGKEFIGLLKADFNITDLSSRLNNWSESDFRKFQTALKEQGVSLSGGTKEDWHERFNRFKKQIKTIDVKIAKHEQELNAAVYALYGLSDAEIAFINRED